MNTEIDKNAVTEIALRSRGTPRIANRLFRRVRDFAQVYNEGVVSSEIAKTCSRSTSCRSFRFGCG